MRGIKQVLVDKDLYDVWICLERNSRLMELVDLLPHNIRVLNLSVSYSDNTTILKYFLAIIERNIQTINLDGHVTDKFLRYLGGSSIRNISISGHQYTDKGLIYLTSFESVKLSYCFQITDLGLKYLSSVPNVGIVSFQNTYITQRGLNYLANANYVQLVLCKLYENKLIHFTNVSDIDIGNDSSIEHQDLKYISNASIVTLNSINVRQRGLSYLRNVKKVKLKSISKHIKSDLWEYGKRYLSHAGVDVVVE